MIIRFTKISTPWNLDGGLIICLLRAATFLWRKSNSPSRSKHSQQALSAQIFLSVCLISSMTSESDSGSLSGTSELMLTHHPLSVAPRGLSLAERWVIETPGRRSKPSNPRSPNSGLGVHQAPEHACEVTARRHVVATLLNISRAINVAGESSRALSDGPSALLHCFHLFHGLCLHVVMSSLCLSPQGLRG